MHIDYTEAQKELRDTLKAYFSQLITPAVREEIRGSEGGGLSGDMYKQIIQQMAKDKWLAVGWPVEYGGEGLSAVEQLIFFEEARLAGAPIPFVTLNTVGPALMAHGSEAHKAKFLPSIASGDTHFAIGYSEPGAGTDLAALSTRAVQDPTSGDWIINGTKMFTSGAEGADYIWLAARTDTDAPKHKGISIFIVDTRDPGFSLAPIDTVGDVRTNMTYYSDVRVPNSMLVGQLNGGWKLITSQLNHERIGLAAFSIFGVGMQEKVIAWASETDHGDGRVIEQPRVQAALAESHAKLEAMRLLNVRMAGALDRGEVNPALASAMKVYSTECLIHVYKLLMQVVGSAGLLLRGSTGAQLNGDLEQEYRQCQINTFGGGVNEVQRDLIARFGLNMVRQR